MLFLVAFLLSAITFTAAGPGACTQSGCDPFPNQACVWAFFNTDCNQPSATISGSYNECINLGTFNAAYRIQSVGDINAAQGLVMYRDQGCQGASKHFSGHDHFRDLGEWKNGAGSIKFTFV
jgi:hypothetical protein